MCQNLGVPAQNQYRVNVPWGLILLGPMPILNAVWKTFSQNIITMFINCHEVMICHSGKEVGDLEN